MLMAEEVLLLLVDDRTGRFLVDSTRLDNVLAGAVLVELVTIERGGLPQPAHTIVTYTPPAQPQGKSGQSRLPWAAEAQAARDRPDSKPIVIRSRCWQPECGRKTGGLPRTRRRSVHEQPEPVKGACGVTA